MSNEKCSIYFSYCGPSSLNRCCFWLTKLLLKFWMIRHWYSESVVDGWEFSSWPTLLGQIQVEAEQFKLSWATEYLGLFVCYPLTQIKMFLSVISPFSLQVGPWRVLLIPREGGERGDGAAPDQVASRDRLHLHHLVQARPLQLGQHREGETLPLLVNT